MYSYRFKNLFPRQSGSNSNLHYYIINGILFTLMTSFSKTYATKFLFRLGGTEYHASLYNALPGIVAAFATIPGIIWVNKTRDKRNTMGRFFLSSRIFTLLLAFVPFLPPLYQPIVFVLISAVMNFPESISVTALQSFSGDIFLPEERSGAIAQRNKFSTLVQILSFLILGQLLSKLGTSEGIIIKKYQIFFVIAFLFGLWEIKTFYKLKEVSCNSTKTNNLSFKGSLKEVFSNRKFMVFLICSLLFHFGWQMGWPLFSIFQIQYLKADEWWLTILNITSNTTMFLSFSYWNRLIKSKGNAFVIMTATAGMSFTPILYVLSFNLYIHIVACLIMGFFTSGTVTVVLTSLLEVVPEENRIIYVGIHATLTNVTLAIAPMIGDRILSHNNIQIALIATTLFRSVGSIAFTLRSWTIKKRSRLNASM